MSSDSEGVRVTVTLETTDERETVDSLLTLLERPTVTEWTIRKGSDGGTGRPLPVVGECPPAAPLPESPLPSAFGDGEIVTEDEEVDP